MIDAIGIINFEDSSVKIEGLEEFRPLPAISFYGRYRMIDFILSNMTNSGVEQILVHIKEKPRSVIDHLGTGQHYNINSKRGRLRMLYGESKFISDIYNTDIRSFIENLQYVEVANQEYVVVAPSYMVYRVNFEDVLKAHSESDADISILYHPTNKANSIFVNCDSLILSAGERVVGFDKNLGTHAEQYISLEAYVMKRELFIDLVQRAAKKSELYWFKDILHDVHREFNIKGYKVDDYVACINSLESYYHFSMDLKNVRKANLFSKNWPLHTMTNDSPPTRYSKGAEVKSSIVANGCHIDGKIKSCVIGRNVIIEDGAVVKNSVLLSGAFVAKGAKLNHVIVDKSAMISNVKEIEGTEEKPIYVRRKSVI